MPEHLRAEISFGMRVEVPLRNRLYAGIVLQIMPSDWQPEFSTKSVISVIDPIPVISEKQLELWHWLASYYLCTLGEVMNVALPSGLKLNSETLISMEKGIQWEHLELSDDEFLIVEALEMQDELTIKLIQDILDKKTVYPVIKKLLDKRLINTREQLKEGYKSRKDTFISLNEFYRVEDADWDEAFKLTSRSKRQQEVLLALIPLLKGKKSIQRKALNDMVDCDASVLKALEKKGIIHLEVKEVSRLEPYEGNIEPMPPLSKVQKMKVEEIREGWKEKHHTVLHGVTGSGKTRIYQEFIQEVIETGGQVLYLLPEIGLTSQIVHRLNRVFGDQVNVFHSKLNVHKRVEIWNACRNGHPILIGARSSLFLPFKDLQLIIVDEEHDSSFKQMSPNPRYHARDVAAYLSFKSGAKLILGSATPSVETYHNAMTGKYTYIPLMERHGNVSLPSIEIVDTANSSNFIPNSRHYTVRLISEIQEVLQNKEQVLLFQNRRGYSPTLICNSCGWNSGCQNCDISMTYHKIFKELRCHYCSARAEVPQACPQCGAVGLFDLGLGTEKVEDELKLLLPEARIARMDLDTAGSKGAIENILLNFELGRTDILIGTQMVTKGLDFDKIGLVGILDADRLIQFPDFRSNERAFQLMLQVGGRAGRREKQGKVIIQSSMGSHPVLKDVLGHDYHSFVKRELAERKQFNYPPYSRLVNIRLQHKDPKLNYRAASYLANRLKSKLGKRVLGPAVPGVARLRGLFQQHILIKMEKHPSILHEIKMTIAKERDQVKAHNDFKSVRVYIDIDPV